MKDKTVGNSLRQMKAELWVIFTPCYIKRKIVHYHITSVENLLQPNIHTHSKISSS